MMALYAKGSPTTMNDTINVFDLGSSSMVTENVVVPTGETESPVNPVNVDVTVQSCSGSKEPGGSEPHQECLNRQRGVGIGHSPYLGCKSSDELSKGFAVPCIKPRSDAAIGLGRVLTMKLSLNSFIRESKEEMDDGLSRLYHIRAGPLRVVRKARHMRESEVS
ncbi:hypothetical protein BHM03_00042494 [Ensete ventricosum]|nr:hypothetical protein BHM03_00042494 [Ensete ventricosum]